MTRYEYQWATSDPIYLTAEGEKGWRVMSGASYYAPLGKVLMERPSPPAEGDDDTQ